GTQYTLGSQMRLRPGIYTRIKQNGETESHVNVMPGHGLPHRLTIDPATGVFHLVAGQARYPLLPILRYLGASDAQLRAAWGNDLRYENQKKADAGAVDKFHKKLNPRASGPPQ